MIKYSVLAFATGRKFDTFFCSSPFCLSLYLNIFDQLKLSLNFLEGYFPAFLFLDFLFLLFCFATRFKQFSLAHQTVPNKVFP